MSPLCVPYEDQLFHSVGKRAMTTVLVALTTLDITIYAAN